MGLFSNLFKQDEKTNEEYLEFLLTKLEKIKTEKAMLEAGENSQLSDLQAQIQKEKQEKKCKDACQNHLHCAGLWCGRRGGVSGDELYRKAAVWR